MLEEGLDGLSSMIGCCGTSSMEIKYSIMAVFGSAGGKMYAASRTQWGEYQYYLQTRWDTYSCWEPGIFYYMALIVIFGVWFNVGSNFSGYQF